MTEKVVLILMVVFALLTIRERKLRTAVIYMCTFSLIGSFVYLLYGAPDVAIAEAVIGSALATVLYLVALRKYRIFTVYYTIQKDAHIDPAQFHASRKYFISMIDRLCHVRELESHFIDTTEDPETIEMNHQFDLIAMQGENEIFVYGSKESYQLDMLIDCFNNSCERLIKLTFVKT